MTITGLLSKPETRLQQLQWRAQI